MRLPLASACSFPASQLAARTPPPVVRWKVKSDAPWKLSAGMM
jgi:hypothetical protein